MADVGKYDQSRVRDGRGQVAIVLRPDALVILAVGDGGRRGECFELRGGKGGQGFPHLVDGRIETVPLVRRRRQLAIFLLHPGEIGGEHRVLVEAVLSPETSASAPNANR